VRLLIPLLVLLSFYRITALHALPASPDNRTAWHGMLRWPEDREGRHASTDPNAAGITLHGLVPGRWLVEGVCALGAYRGSRVFYVWDETISPPSRGACPS
jgi:hypothetical protein